MSSDSFCEEYWCGNYTPTMKEFKKMGEWESLSSEFQQLLIETEEESRLLKRTTAKMKRNAFKNIRGRSKQKKNLIAFNNLLSECKSSGIGLPSYRRKRMS